jgi:hypothetical protein
VSGASILSGTFHATTKLKFSARLFITVLRVPGWNPALFGEKRAVAYETVRAHAEPG